MWEYKGYKCQLLGCSYNCPSLKLFGYGTERQLHGAINKKLKTKVNSMQIKTFEDFCSSVGSKILWRYPKSTLGGEQKQGVIIFQEGAANPYRIKYVDIDQSFQSEGIWKGQIEKGNVEIFLVA